MLETIKVDEKYSIVIGNDDGRFTFKALRYGEEWMTNLSLADGSNMIMAMAYEIQKLRKEVDDLSNPVENKIQRFVDEDVTILFEEIYHMADYTGEGQGLRLIIKDKAKEEESLVKDVIRFTKPEVISRFLCQFEKYLDLNPSKQEKFAWVMDKYKISKSDMDSFR